MSGARGMSLERERFARRAAGDGQSVYAGGPASTTPSCCIVARVQPMRSTHCARQAGGSDGGAKYQVSRSTLLSRSSSKTTSNHVEPSEYVTAPVIPRKVPRANDPLERERGCHDPAVLGADNTIDLTGRPTAPGPVVVDGPVVCMAPHPFAGLRPFRRPFDVARRAERAVVVSDEGLNPLMYELFVRWWGHWHLSPRGRMRPLR